jgi:hypothetical protein
MRARIADDPDSWGKPANEPRRFIVGDTVTLFTGEVWRVVRATGGDTAEVELAGWDDI